MSGQDGKAIGAEATIAFPWSERYFRIHCLVLFILITYLRCLFFILVTVHRTLSTRYLTIRREQPGAGPDTREPWIPPQPMISPFPAQDLGFQSSIFPVY